MANRSFAGLPLPSVIFRSQSFADLASPSQGPPAEYTGDYARTETALPRFHEAVAPPPPPAPVQEQAGELKKKRSFFTGRRTAKSPPALTPSKTKRSVWRKAVSRVKRSFSGLKPKKKEEPEEPRELAISSPYNFQHVGGFETLVAPTAAPRAAAEQQRQGEDVEGEQPSFDDGNSAWEDVTEHDFDRRI